MKTAIKGKIRIKLFWGCPYSNKRMKPIQQLFSIGKLRIYKVVYPKYNLYCISGYKESVIEELKNYYNVLEEPTPHQEPHDPRLHLFDDTWIVCRSKIDNGYVGLPEDAYRILQRGIINVQKSESNYEVCNIGWNPKEQKWYGWSHRAMYGFGIGDIVKEGDCCASSGWTDEYLIEHPEEDKSLPIGYKAKSLDDAKRMAIAFAESVS